MTKTNSLKLVPYATEWHWDFDKGERIQYRSLLEYTHGKPGEQTSVGYGEHGAPIDWLPNEPFRETLRIDHLERGRSAARFWFVGTDDTRYPFFGQGLVEMLSEVTMEHGIVTANWIAVKRGANYGIERYEGDV
jgi:hypothetical protein